MCEDGAGRLAGWQAGAHLAVVAGLQRLDVIHLPRVLRLQAGAGAEGQGQSWWRWAGRRHSSGRPVQSTQQQAGVAGWLAGYAPSRGSISGIESEE